MFPMTKLSFQLVSLLVLIFFHIHESLDNLCPTHQQCECLDMNGGISVKCTMLNNLTILHDIIQNKFHDKLFSQVKILNCSADTFTTDTLNNTNIQALIFECPFQSMENDSLKNIDYLTSFDFMRLRFSEIPVAIQQLKEVRFLKLRKGKLKRLGTELMSMPLLSRITLKSNEIENVSYNAFWNNSNLKVIILSFNRISWLHPDTFIKCKNIELIHLEDNRLRSALGLFRSEFLMNINVRKNGLQTVNGLFENYVKIEKIDFGENSNIDELTENTFSSNTRFVQELYLDRCQLLRLPSELLKPLAALEKIDVSFNNLVTVPEGFFHNLQHLKTVYLQGNKIQHLQNIFYGNIQLQQLDLFYNKISSLKGTFHNITSIRRISLYHNHIRSLSQDDFASCIQLRSLSLRRNYIYEIGNSTFSNLKEMVYLSLASNKLVVLNHSIQNLPQLKTLDLFSNDLVAIDEHEMKNLPQLKYLNLRNNKLKTVKGAFRDIHSLSSLGMNVNKLRTLSRISFSRDFNVKHLGLTTNKWTCDCRLSWLRDWMIQGNSSTESTTLTCSFPLRHRSKMLRDLSARDLFSWPDDCPDDCECTCVPEDDEFHVRVDCSGRGLQAIPQTLPIHTKELYLQGNLLTSPLNFDKSIFGDLMSLDLERNSLQSLDFYLPKNLTMLKLASNNLTRFFNSKPSENIKIWSLSDNPWICDCETMDFKTWMIAQKNKIIDVNETRCSSETEDEDLRDQIIVFLHEAQLCPTSVSTVIVITVGFLMILLAITSTILLHSKYRYHLKVWLYSRGLTWLKKAEDQDIDKLHDAYVSAAEEDLHLIVRYLIPELEEKEPYYSLYVSGRDMLGGEFEIDKQMEEVKKSKRIIILLSEHYFQDQFCMEIFKLAFSSSLKEKLYRLILIVVGELPSLSGLDKNLRAAIETTKCLRFEQKLFREMLKFAMPRKDPLRIQNGTETTDVLPLLP